MSLWTWGYLAVYVGMSKQAGGICEYNKPIGCSTSVALARGPTEEEELHEHTKSGLTYRRSQCLQLVHSYNGGTCWILQVHRRRSYLCNTLLKMEGFVTEAVCSCTGSTKMADNITQETPVCCYSLKQNDRSRNQSTEGHWWYQNDRSIITQLSLPSASCDNLYS